MLANLLFAVSLTLSMKPYDSILRYPSTPVLDPDGRSKGSRRRRYIPLSEPGSSISISIGASSRSYALWRPDAKQFKPDRWLIQVGISGKAEEIHGHGHLLILVDGPRTCLGKEFVVVELKKVSSILVKNFVFEMQDGPETQVEVAGVLTSLGGPCAPRLISKFANAPGWDVPPGPPFPPAVLVAQLIEDGPTVLQM
ncbi:hypothetical protein EDB19DRAFT_1953556 [Suillus lakei]|nr:hypothetical protein EDB19DRAFT_1953556 [Suillus lakei]